jgi:hypothetical protein
MFNVQNAVMTARRADRKAGDIRTGGQKLEFMLGCPVNQPEWDLRNVVSGRSFSKTDARWHLLLSV